MSEAKLVTFSRDAVILKEGEFHTDMYKIIKGHAEIYTGYGTPSESILGIIGPQSCFGEFGLLLKKPSIYTVIAYSDVLALRFTESELGNFVKENHKNIIDIMRNMANSMMSMRLQNDQLIKELEESKKPDEVDFQERIREARRAMRQYAVYNPGLHGQAEQSQTGSINKIV